MRDKGKLCERERQTRIREKERKHREIKDLFLYTACLWLEIKYKIFHLTENTFFKSLFRGEIMQEHDKYRTWKYLSNKHNSKKIVFISQEVFTPPTKKDFLS